MSENPLPNIDFSGLDPWGNKRREARTRLYSAWSQALKHGIIVRHWLEILEEFEKLPVRAMEEEDRILRLVKQLEKK